MPRRSDHPPASRPLGSDDADRVADVMSAFGAGSRIRLLYALLGPERSVEDLAEMTKLSASVVSQQLRVLRLYRMVEGRRDGRHVRYSISDEHVVDLLVSVRAHVDHLTAAPAATDTRTGEQA